MSLPSLVALSCFLLTLPAQQSPERPQPRRGVLPKELVATMPVAAAQTRVVLKLAEGRPELVADGRIRAADVLAVLGSRPVQSFFAGGERQLAQLRQRQLAAAAPGTTPPVDLGLYFEAKTRDAADTVDLIARLNALPSVELAYARELPTPPPGDILPLTPDYTANQGYRAAAPGGVDAATMLSCTGAGGGGVRVLDIEWGWRFDHEDLAALRAPSLVGPPISNHSYDDHGTAVIGELAADADHYGMTGLVPDVQVLVTTNYPASGYSVANAINVGLPFLAAGDVMLLEAQTSTPLGLGPTEWVQADFDAILVATTLGVITVEAAGNGGVNLDAPALGGVFQLSVRDSGAIIVGATTAATLQRAGFSCYGSRIDANGWGSSVASTGYGDLATVGGDPRQAYTNVFGGTSGASPMVTSAVAALRGAARAQLEPAAAAALDWSTIRNLLRTTGTVMNAGQGIGRRPDAAALMAAAGIARGLTLRGEPATGQTCFVDLVPTFAATAGDFYGLLGGLQATNAPLPAPFAPNTGRLLVDTATSVPLGFGTFAAVPATLQVDVPNHPSLRGVRYYVQGVTLVGASGALEASNSVQILVRR